MFLCVFLCMYVWYVCMYVSVQVCVCFCVCFLCMYVWYVAVYVSVCVAGGAQCDAMVNITAANNNQRVLVNRVAGTGRVCLRCLDANGEIDETGTIWSLNDGTSVSQGQNVPNVAEYDNGVLVLQPGVLGNGRTGEYGPVTCFAGALSIVIIKLYSSGK